MLPRALRWRLGLAALSASSLAAQPACKFSKFQNYPSKILPNALRLRLLPSALRLRLSLEALSASSLAAQLVSKTSIVYGHPFVRRCSTSSVQGRPKADFCLWFRPSDRPCPTSSVQGRPSFL